MNFLLDLRETAKAHRDTEIRDRLNELAETIRMAVLELNLRITTENLQSLNGLWARADRTLQAAKKEIAAYPWSAQS